MTFERIPSPSHPLYADAMALYGISFPAHEQRETPSQTAILTHPDYHFTAILDGSHFVGDMLYWETLDFRYIEHFCILPALRGQRYGSHALSMLPCDRPVILEIDPPVDEIAIRRAGVFRIVCVAEVSGAVRHVPARLFALPASGVCPAGRPRHVGFPAGNCRALRLFLARGVHPRIPRRLRRDPQRVPPAPDCRRPPHHFEAFRLLSAWHRRNGHGRID